MSLKLPLERQGNIETNLLFVYGTLRRDFNHPMARLLALRAHYWGTGRLNGRLYHLGSYPGATFSRHSDEWVQGDIYEPKSLRGLLALLDRYEGLPSGRKRKGEYLRVKAPIQLNDGTAVLAWLYLCRLPVNRSKRLLTGDFVRERRRPPQRAGLSP